MSTSAELPDLDHPGWERLQRAVAAETPKRKAGRLAIVVATAAVSLVAASPASAEAKHVTGLIACLSGAPALTLTNLRDYSETIKVTTTGRVVGQWTVAGYASTVVVVPNVAATFVVSDHNDDSPTTTVTTSGCATVTPPHKVLVCHATGSASNPFVLIEVDSNSTDLHGHRGHVGDMFDRADCDPPTPSTTVAPTTTTTAAATTSTSIAAPPTAPPTTVHAVAPPSIGIDGCVALAAAPSACNRLPETGVAATDLAVAATTSLLFGAALLLSIRRRRAH